MTRNSFNGQGIGLWFSAQVLTCPSFFFSSAMMSLPNFSFQMGFCEKKIIHPLRSSFMRETDKGKSPKVPFHAITLPYGYFEV